jgi:serine/threonine protein kinase
MGAVFKAWDERLQRWVAVKSIEPGQALNPESRERLRREARAVAGLSHPALAQVFDIVSEEELDYIVMEFVPGRSLARVLVGGKLAVSRALRIGSQVAAGLAAAHSRGVIHRDLKAENVMIGDEDRATILDFGLAKRFDSADAEESLTGDGVVMGTTRSMSPEQAQGFELDHRSDIFSLGSLLYEMVTGRHPFQAGSPLETMERVVRHTPRAAHSLDPLIPERVSEYIARLLAKEKDRRPTDATRVADVLADLARQVDADGEVHIPTAPELGVRPLPAWLAIALAAVAAAVAAALLFL